MLITAEEVKKIDKFKNYAIEDIERKLKKIEYAIRSHTHNQFLSKSIRFNSSIENNVILFNTQYIKKNDTILIKNEFCKDIFTISEIVENGLKIKEDIINSKNNLIVKVIYPFDIIEGALDVLEWDFKMRNKVGIKSETISRHSTTYYDNDSNNTVNGYPVSLFGFSKPYRKART